MAEFFTWECLWANSCEGCKVSEFVAEKGLDQREQREMLAVATGASGWLETGEDPEVVIQQFMGREGLSDEGVRVAVEGYVQWEEKSCRDTIVEIASREALGKG